MINIAVKLLFTLVHLVSAETPNNLDCKDPEFFDIAGDKVEVSKEELKSGQKRLETIDYVEVNFDAKKIRLYADGSIKDANNKKYSAINKNRSFTWVYAYKFNEHLILRPEFSDGVDITVSALYVLAPQTFEPLATFDLPCMHEDEKIFVFNNRLTYACQREVEGKEGLVHSYNPKEKRWLDVKSAKTWDFFAKEKDLTELKVKQVMKFWKNAPLSIYEKRCD